MDRKAALETRCAVDLAGNQQRPVQQERGPLLLDDLKAGALEGAAAGRRQHQRLAARKRESAATPELWMDEHGDVGFAQRPDQPVHAGDVVEVAVAEHDHLDVAR